MFHSMFYSMKKNKWRAFGVGDAPSSPNVWLNPSIYFTNFKFFLFSPINYAYKYFICIGNNKKFSNNKNKNGYRKVGIVVRVLSFECYSYFA